MMNRYKKCIGVLLGNSMQFYDFTIYAFLTKNISKQFFDFQDTFISYLAVFSVFAGGYLARPFGALLFGHIGDRRGRTQALSITLIYSTIATFSIGILPDYQTIGIFAPILLIVLRLIQGISVSGEEGGAVVLLFEKFSFTRKGLVGSIVLSSVLAGVMLGSIVCVITNWLIMYYKIESWGWRIPFLLSLPLGLISMYLRYMLNDFSLFEKAKQKNLLVKIPAKTLIMEHGSSVVYGLIICSLYSISTSTIIVHMPYLLSIKLKWNQDISLLLVTASLLVTSVFSMFFGIIFDKIKPTKIYAMATIIMIGLAPGLFYSLSIDNFCLTIASIFLFSVIIGLISSTIFSLLTEIFPFGIRYSGVSFSFNFSITIFSSTTPLFLIFLEEYFDTIFIGGLYLSFLSALLLFITCVFLKKLSLKKFNESDGENLLYSS